MGVGNISTTTVRVGPVLLPPKQKRTLTHVFVQRLPEEPWGVPYQQAFALTATKLTNSPNQDFGVWKNRGNGPKWGGGWGKMG